MNAPFLTADAEGGTKSGFSNGLQFDPCTSGADPIEWREAVEARIEQLHDALLSLIATLDILDGDTDLEPWLAGAVGTDGDREGGDPLDEGEPNDWDDEDSDADEDNGDEEPFGLGWAGSSE